MSELVRNDQKLIDFRIARLEDSVPDLSQLEIQTKEFLTGKISEKSQIVSSTADLLEVRKFLIFDRLKHKKTLELFFFFRVTWTFVKICANHR